MDPKELGQIKQVVNEKMWEGRNVSIDFQKQTKESTIEELESRISMGIISGSKLEFTKFILEQKKRDKSEATDVERHKDSIEIARSANCISKWALVISGLSLIASILVAVFK